MDEGAKYSQIPHPQHVGCKIPATLAKVSLVCEIDILHFLNQQEPKRCQNNRDVGWATNVCNDFPRAQAPKESPTLNSHISNLPTRSILFDIEIEHVQYHELHVHAQTNWV